LSPSAQTFDLAMWHLRAGNLQTAEQLYRQVLERDPRHADAWRCLGLLAKQVGRLDLAVENIRRCLLLSPGYASAHFNLGNVLREQRLLEQAAASYRQAIHLKPDFAEAHKNLANVLKDQGQLDEAEACYDEAIRLKPDLAEAHFNLGNILLDGGRLEKAEVCFQEALRLMPALVEAHTNLGNVFKHQGRFAIAEACFLEALRLKPEFAEGHFNLSLFWLLQGNYVQGWPEFEWRRRTIDQRPYSCPPPTWDGTALDGQTILLQAEEGLGDTLQFVRYARLVKEKGGRVLLQCQPALASILAGCPGIDQLVPRGTPLPAYQVSAPLLSLPLLFGTTLETIPAPVPYLAVDPARVEHWRARLAAIPGFKVGICWQGNPSQENDWRRSVPLVQFAPLAAIPGVCLVALQRGAGLEQMGRAAEQLSIVDLPGRSEDPAEGWLDTAALIQALDLVISIESAVAHLAGAMAAPVWVPLAFMPAWRWLLDREDSPWYPTMRLFRQPQAGNWTAVFERVAEELRKKVAA
jgi:tetratricopeptide (TPR) repeat protein